MIPVHYMRGGTLTQVMIWEPLLPSDERLLNELIRHLTGVHQPGQAPGNRQVSALGRGPATSKKVLLVSIEAPPPAGTWSERWPRLPVTMVTSTGAPTAETCRLT